MTDLEDITALILCGGGGARLGGVDKPLEAWRDKPLVEHALAGLPQDMPVLISANRNLATYQAFGWPVFADGRNGAGPLAGIAAASTHLKTPWLYVIPGDAPLLPRDLPGALKTLCNQQGATAGCVRLERREPLPLLTHKNELTALNAYLQRAGETGDRSVKGWLKRLNTAELARDDAHAFANFNTPEDFAPS